jgi:rare lipoprotein A
MVLTDLARSGARRARAIAVAGLVCLPAAACATVDGLKGEEPSAASVYSSGPTQIATQGRTGPSRPSENSASITPARKSSGPTYAYAPGVVVPPKPPSIPPTGRISTAQNGLASYQKIGAPYQVGGTWYLPAHEPDYDEKGVASWYGDAFQGRPTANGELFDMNIPSAAHPTLPIPSLVEVTNLENGRKITVRLNDRGPFVQSRIIDLSHRAAELLGYDAQGTVNVRVRYLGPAPAVSIPPQPPFAPQAPISGVQTAGLPTTTFVQAGAFSRRENADAASAKISNLGPSRVTTMMSNGASLFRVLVGPWSDREQAERKVAEATALGFDGARLVSVSQ